MTLKQLQYAVTIAETGNMSEAARKLFIAQPSLTSAIHELEKEYGITIFTRSNKGIELTPDGDEFLGYARQVLEQAGLIEERYTGKTAGKQRFCVSSQHYSFVVEAFVRLIKEQGSHNSFYFSEEILSTADCDKELVVCDRATLFNMLIGLNGYTICSGVISEELNGPNIIARPLEVDDHMEIGYILPGTIHPSQLTLNYIYILKGLV